LATQKSQALAQTRDELLVKTLEVQHNYRDELALAATPEARKAIHANYASRFEGINDAFTVLRQSEPGITTKIDAEQLRHDAERHSEEQARRREFEQSMSRSNIEHSRSLTQTGAGTGFGF
jgi:hypothetical protein